MRRCRRDGWLDTGDLGYLLNGQIVITGRAKDLIILNGRNIWPQDLEWAAEDGIAELRRGDVAAISIENPTRKMPSASLSWSSAVQRPGGARQAGARSRRGAAKINGGRGQRDTSAAACPAADLVRQAQPRKAKAKFLGGGLYPRRRRGLRLTAMSMRVAVTGATGFVGSHVIRRLTAGGHAVRILARRMPITALTPNRPLEVVLGDLDDLPSLHRLVAGVDAVIHVAGVIKARHAADFHRVNVEGTRHVAKALCEVSPDLRVIHVSSLAAREPGLSPYCASKRGGEEAIGALPNPARLTILRPPAVYGPGDVEIFPMFKAAALGFCAYPAARQSRLSLIHAADLAAAIVAAAETPCPIRSTSWTDGHGGGYAWAEIGAGLSAALGRSVRMIRSPARSSKPSRRGGGTPPGHRVAHRPFAGQGAGALSPGLGGPRPSAGSPNRLDSGL